MQVLQKVMPLQSMLPLRVAQMLEPLLMQVQRAVQMPVPQKER